MDGEFNFNSGVIGGLRHAARSGELPEFIIVGNQPSIEAARALNTIE